MSLPVARPAGDECELKITAAAALVPGQVITALPGKAGVVQGTQNIAIGDPAVLAIKGKYDIDCATGTTASAGDPAFFNTSTKLVVTAGGANIIEVGQFAHAKTSGQLKATILLNEKSASASASFLAAAQNAMTTAGAVSVATYYTTVNTTSGSGHASTLADGTFVGQQKKIQLIVDGGDLVLTPANLAGGTTITFADAGDFALLVWNGVDWVAVQLGNDADGATAPVLA